jgi:hypothetical protein
MTTLGSIAASEGKRKKIFRRLMVQKAPCKIGIDACAEPGWKGKLKKVKIVSEIFQGLDDITVHHLTVTDTRYYVDELP